MLGSRVLLAVVVALPIVSCATESDEVRARSETADITASDISLRSPLAAAMASDGKDVLVVNGLDDDGGATAYLVMGNDTVTTHTMASEPLASPIAWWDGARYVVGGLPCPGWEGQAGTDTTFVSSYCGTTTYQLYGIDPANGAVARIGEAEGGELGALSVAAVNGSTALLRVGPANEFLRFDTKDGTSIAHVNLDATNPAGVCPSGADFVAFTTPSLSLGAGVAGSPSEGVTRHRLLADQQVWMAEAIPDSDLPDQTALVFGGCDGDRVIIAAHETATEVRYLILSASDVTAPWDEITLPGLQPFTTIGMVDGVPLALTRISDPPSYRIDRIADGRLERLGEAVGMVEAPRALAQTKSTVAFLAETTDSRLQFRRPEQ